MAGSVPGELDRDQADGDADHPSGPDLTEFLTGVADAVGAARAVALTVTPDGTALRPAWTVGYTAGYMSGWPLVEISPATPLGHAALSRGTVVVADESDVAARYPSILHHRLFGPTQIVSRAALDRDGVLRGVLGMTFDHGDGAADLASAVAGVEQASGAFAALVAGPRSSPTDTAAAGPDGPPPPPGPGPLAEDEPQGLRRLATRLVAAVTPEDVVDIVDEMSAQVLGSGYARLTLLTGSGGQHLVDTRGALAEVDGRYPELRSHDRLPAVDVAATGRPLWFPDRDDAVRRYPAMADFPLPQEGLAVVPLRGPHGPLGTFLTGWWHPQPFDAHQREAVQVIADLCTSALLRTRAAADERRAREEAETAGRRLTDIADLAAELGICRTPRQVAEVLVSVALRATRADAASVTDGGDGGGQVELLAWHGDTDVAATGIDRRDISRLSLFQEQRRTLRPILVRSREEARERFPDLAGTEITQQAWANLPLVVRGELRGTAAFGWNDPRDFDESEIAFLATLARHAALAMDRTALLAATRETAQALQQALLPSTDALPGLQVARRYLPAQHATEVGGDWYDAFALGEGRFGLTLGDVEGKGIEAAAIMGAVRHAMRAYATVTPDPVSVLCRVEEFLAAFPQGRMVTACYALLDTRARQVTFTGAGHPPPVLARTGQEAILLDHAQGPPLGLAAMPGRPTARTAATVDLGPGAWALVLYSDGLVERRLRPVTSGLADLAAAATALVRTSDQATIDVEAGLDHLLATLVPDGSGDDDIAVITVRGEA